MPVKFDSGVMTALFGEVWEKPPAPALIPVKEKEPETFSLQEQKTLYRNPHRVKMIGNRLEIHEAGERLPEDAHPRDFDELLAFMDKHGMAVKATSEGLLFTGGSEEQHQSVIACLNSSIWIYGNLRLYLDGELRDINGRKYRHPLVKRR